MSAFWKCRETLALQGFFVWMEKESPLKEMYSSDKFLFSFDSETSITEQTQLYKVSDEIQREYGSCEKWLNDTYNFSAGFELVKDKLKNRFVEILINRIECNNERSVSKYLVVNPSIKNELQSIGEDILEKLNIFDKDVKEIICQIMEVK